MVIIVQQGQRIELTTRETDLSRILVGLGWDPVATSACEKNQPPDSDDDAGPPLIQPIDCDASVLMLNAERKLRRKEDIIYYRNLRSLCKSVQHMGDSRTGEQHEDDEQILIDLKLIPPAIHTLLFVVTIYDCETRRQDFSFIRNAYIRIVNLANRHEIMRFKLTDPYVCKTALIVGEIFRMQDDWKFGAIGEGTEDTSLFEIARRFA
ncbi:TerD family protein [candidate division KSB3 bacterium]|uniref:TerD family protein n=1 Tax=candidate division KSB3 bacterium TaxID=2044937 RepID=A0A9D5JYU8_9BACT|nr:TerD family protein [candidate division KSB3 bacterium]MBD3326643.1 TerD family protein [candidate division KSB3 bacterium]